MAQASRSAGDLLVECLDDLKTKDHKRFRDKLSDFRFGNRRCIGKSHLEEADSIDTKNQLISHYGEDAVEVTIQVLELIGLSGPADDLRKERDELAKQNKEEGKKVEGCSAGNNNNFVETHYEALCHRLTTVLAPILLALNTRGVLNEYEEEEINSKRLSIEKNEALLKMIRKKNATEEFYQILKEYDPKLVQDLKKSC